MTSSDDDLPAFQGSWSLPRSDFGAAGRRYERDARRAYQAVVAAALESLRHAEELFYEAVALIDAHMHRAVAGRGDPLP